LNKRYSPPLGRINATVPLGLESRTTARIRGGIFSFSSKYRTKIKLFFPNTG
jgi:hypothetical protein